jgi:hypothetical protein
MIAAVSNALTAILGANPSLNNASGAGRIFELYIMTGIAREMQSLGFDVWLQRSDGSRILPTDPTREFVQRGGAPAGIAPASAGAGNPSVIGICRPNGSSWELWNGVQFEGRSGAFHELDLALVPASVGNQLRQTGGRPLGRPRVAIECKDVTAVGSADEMRTLVARLYDLTILDAHRTHLGLPLPALAIYPDSPTAPFYASRITFWDENRHSFNVLARRTTFSGGAYAMTGYHAISGFGAVSLNSANYTSLIQGVAQWINTTLP